MIFSLLYKIIAYGAVKPLFGRRKKSFQTLLPIISFYPLDFFCEKSALAAIPEERMLDEMLTTGLLNFFFTGLLLAGLPEPLMGEGRVNLEASFSF